MAEPEGGWDNDPGHITLVESPRGIEDCPIWLDETVCSSREESKALKDWDSDDDGNFWWLFRDGTRVVFPKEEHEKLRDNLSWRARQQRGAELWLEQQAPMWAYEEA